MTKINLEDISFICEHISNQDQFALDSESEYYNQELAEAVQDIITTISVSMISEGCSASGVIDFLANAPEQDILEYYLNCNFSEGIVSEEYIQEQIEILSEGVPLGLIGKAVMGGLKNAGRVANIALRRTAGPGVRKAVAGAVTKVKDIAKGVKAALPTVAKGAAVLGLGAAGGAIGAKMAGAGSGSQNTKTAPTTPSGGAVKDLAAYRAGGGGAKSKASGMGTADVEKLGRSNLFKAGGGEAKLKSGLTRQQVMDLGSKNVAAKAKATTKTTPAPAPTSTPSQSSTPAPTSRKPPTQKPPAPKPPATKPTGGQSTMSQQAAELRDMQRASQLRQQGQDVTGANLTSVRKDIEKFNKPEELNKQAPAGTALAAEQERRKKAAAQTTQTAKESYDAYDLVLEYLFETGQVDTINEAHYIMMELDVETIGSIVEAKYGTAAGRKALAKKVRAGEDVGKEGGGFEKIVTKASKKYGKERATKIAAAAMWKNLGKEG